MKVPPQIYDAWKVKPPCQTSQGCKEGCPYLADCNSEEAQYQEDMKEVSEEWDRYFENKHL